jgi:hypothetical protein
MMTARLLSRQTEPDRALIRAQVQTCATACEVCTAQRERHAMERCRVFAEACRRRQWVCNRLLPALPAA